MNDRRQHSSQANRMVASKVKEIVPQNFVTKIKPASAAFWPGGSASPQ